MTATGDFFMGQDSNDLRGRLSGYLRQQYRGGHAIKRLSNDVGCTQKAAENMLGGHWPRAEHLAAIVRHFRRDVLDAVFGPEIEDTVARLEREVRELEQQAETKRLAIRQAAGVVVGRPGGLAAPDRLAEPRSFDGGEP